MSDTNDSDEQLERVILITRIENGEGTLEEQEAWLERLQAIGSHFYECDHMLALEGIVKLNRRVQTLREQIGAPLIREKLITLVQSIDYSKASDREELLEMETRAALFVNSVPHPQADRLLDRVWADRDMSAEEAVDAALSWRVPEIFCLPGSVAPDVSG